MLTSGNRGLLAKAVPYFGLVLFACLVSWIYRQPPKLGDDLDYWRLAMELRLGEAGAWRADSFHHLRWPVWGVCWLLMGVFGISAASYFLQPVVYLSLSACLVFWLAGRAGLPFWGRVAAGAILVMHPLVDTALMRPMPDLSEGFWVALAFGLWLGLMQSSRVGAKFALCAAVGLVLAIAQANRITGAFAVPVLLVGTLLLYPRQLGWLVLCGVFAAGFVVVEAFVYLGLTGDFFHTIHANLGATGRKGTDSMPLWMFPLRFMNSLWRMPYDVLMSSLAVAGALYFWRSGGRPARAVVLYAVVYYLTYSCALQSFFPPRPMVRDGDRFLASLAFPLSILSVGGPMLLWSLLPKTWKQVPVLAFWAQKPWAGIGVLVLAMALLNNRTTGIPNYLQEIADFLRTIPPGSVIVSHPPMRAVATLAAPDAVTEFEWRLLNNVLEPSEALDSAIQGASGIWLIRKHAWLSKRKRSERGDQERLEALAPYLVPPLGGWRPARTILKNDIPDFLFLERSNESLSLEAVAPEEIFPGIDFPDLPFRREFAKTEGRVVWESPVIEVPDDLRGACIFLALRASSDRTEPFRIWLDLATEGSTRVTAISFRPYMFPESSPDFFAFSIPTDATTCRLKVEMNARTRWVEIQEAHFFMTPSTLPPDGETNGQGQ